MKKLLIVEDEIPLLKIMSDEFRGRGIQVIGAGNGKEGLEIALREHPDLILLDLAMPVMDGISMLKKMREDEWGRTAQVLILTNLEGSVEKTLEAIENGVFEYVVKTRWGLDQLKRRVRERLMKA